MRWGNCGLHEFLYGHHKSYPSNKLIFYYIDFDNLKINRIKEKTIRINVSMTTGDNRKGPGYVTSSFSACPDSKFPRSGEELL